MGLVFAVTLTTTHTHSLSLSPPSYSKCLDMKLMSRTTMMLQNARAAGVLVLIIICASLGNTTSIAGRVAANLELVSRCESLLCIIEFV